MDALAAHQSLPEHRADRPSYIWLLFGALLLLVLYALSIGPVANYYRTRPPLTTPRAVVQLYAPLEWLAQNNRAVQVFFNWYIDMLWKAPWPSPAPAAPPTATPTSNK